MAQTNKIMKRLNGVVFGYYHPEEVRRLSVKEINNPVAFDQINRPKKGSFPSKRLILILIIFRWSL